jgi:hypothetical protein
MRKKGTPMGAFKVFQLNEQLPLKTNGPVRIIKG